MPAGTLQDPVILNPNLDFAVSWLKVLLSREPSESEIDSFVRQISPKLRELGPGTYFMFSGRSSTYVIMKDPEGKLFFTKYPAYTNNSRWYLYEAESRPWFPDIEAKWGALKKEVKSFTNLDFMNTDGNR